MKIHSVDCNKNFERTQKQRRFDFANGEFKGLIGLLCNALLLILCVLKWRNLYRLLNCKNIMFILKKKKENIKREEMEIHGVDVITLFEQQQKLKIMN